MQVAHCKHTCCHSAYQLLEEALDSSGALECIPRLPGLQGVDEHLAEATASPRAIQPGSQCLWHHNTQVIEASLQRCRHCLSTLCLASPLLNSTPPSLRPLAYRLLLATCATSCCSIGSACAAGVALTEKLCGALWMSHCVNQKSSRSGGASQAAYSYGFRVGEKAVSWEQKRCTPDTGPSLHQRANNSQFFLSMWNSTCGAPSS
eukprot:CAMPEP_0115547196 /NCGR_PEP_ID=MMETSP0271-20121206/93521_1 /TAXON_ID=71861 /ORGANISM="Scrippsiella trochoidea, Strain CCMP3099" /LENGTH=204 /DNA_ID=CAMNT_0002980619 /DNA_START=120 /DNA_END=734 /DNA_ORIENTATION=-